MEYTENYHLNQWEPTDRVLREDFNEDNRKIDAALNGKTEIVIGSYDGNSSSYTSSQEITLGWKPQAVLVFATKATSGELQDLPAQMATAAHSGTSLSISETGFIVQNYLNMTYLSPYRYWAIR